MASFARRNLERDVRRDLTCCQTAQAQDGLTYDLDRRVYVLEYVDDYGDARSTEIVPPNHVEPILEVVVETDGLFDYGYTIGNAALPAVDQGIRRLEIECPVEVTEVSAPDGWYALSEDSRHTGEHVCAFGEKSSPIAPGGRLGGFHIRSHLLPGVVGVDVWGRLEQGPTQFPGVIDGRPELMELADSIQGGKGGWVDVETVGPAVSSESIADPVSGTDHLVGVLSQACDLAWLDDSDGICHSLQVKLEQARASIAADRPAARYQMQSFLNELDAQRGQHVDESAYWLLTVLGQHVLATI